MKTDEKIRRVLREGAPSMPEEMSNRFDRTLVELAAKKRPHRRYRLLRPVMAGAVTAFVLIFFLPAQYECECVVRHAGAAADRRNCKNHIYL